MFELDKNLMSKDNFQFCLPEMLLWLWNEAKVTENGFGLGWWVMQEWLKLSKNYPMLDLKVVALQVSR